MRVPPLYRVRVKTGGERSNYENFLQWQPQRSHGRPSFLLGLPCTPERARDVPSFYLCGSLLAQTKDPKFLWVPAEIQRRGLAESLENLPDRFKLKAGETGDEVKRKRLQHREDLEKYLMTSRLECLWRTYADAEVDDFLGPAHLGDFLTMKFPFLVESVQHVTVQAQDETIRDENECDYLVSDISDIFLAQLLWAYSRKYRIALAGHFVFPEMTLLAKEWFSRDLDRKSTEESWFPEVDLEWVENVLYYATGEKPWESKQSR